MTGDLSFERFAALCAISLGAIGVAYSIAVVVFLRNSSHAVLVGFIVNPAFFVWLGLVLWGRAGSRRRRESA